jgi:hypothetical protein
MSWQQRWLASSGSGSTASSATPLTCAAQCMWSSQRTQVCAARGRGQRVSWLLLAGPGCHTSCTAAVAARCTPPTALTRPPRTPCPPDLTHTRVPRARGGRCRDCVPRQGDALPARAPRAALAASDLQLLCIGRGGDSARAPARAALLPSRCVGVGGKGSCCRQPCSCSISRYSHHLLPVLMPPPPTHPHTPPPPHTHTRTRTRHDRRGGRRHVCGRI